MKRLVHSWLPCCLENELDFEILFVLYEEKTYSFHRRTESLRQIVFYHFFNFQSLIL